MQTKQRNIEYGFQGSGEVYVNVEEINYRLESCVHYTLSNPEKPTREE